MSCRIRISNIFSTCDAKITVNQAGLWSQSPGLFLLEHQDNARDQSLSTLLNLKKKLKISWNAAANCAQCTFEHPVVAVVWTKAIAVV